MSGWGGFAKMDNFGQQMNTVVIINNLAKDIHETNKANGFWEGEPNIGEKLALIHAEVSEALEAIRTLSPQPDKHLPAHTNFNVELGDIVIRVLDLAIGLDPDCNIGGIIVAKAVYNKSREIKHGKKF